MDGVNLGGSGIPGNIESPSFLDYDNELDAATLGQDIPQHGQLPYQGQQEPFYHQFGPLDDIPLYLSIPQNVNIQTRPLLPAVKKQRVEDGVLYAPVDANAPSSAIGSHQDASANRNLNPSEFQSEFQPEFQIPVSGHKPKRELKTSPKTKHKQSKPNVGTPFPNHILMEVSFSHDPSAFTRNMRKNETSQEKMHNVEFRVLLQYNYSSNVSTRYLVSASALSLMANYLRATGVKFFKNVDVERIAKLRKVLHRLSLKYFNECVTLLKELISKPDIEISMALVMSSVLNKITLYESKSFQIPATFTNGMVSIFHDLYKILRFDTFTKELSWCLNFLEFASKSFYFPKYNPAFLEEYIEKMELFRHSLEKYFRIFHTDPRKQLLIFSYNSLLRFMKYVHSVFQNHQRSGKSQILALIVYEILRKWYTILPPGVQILEHLSNPMELIICYMFLSVGRCLDNLFPDVMYMFLFSFNGGVHFYISFYTKKVLEFDEEYQRALGPQLIEEIRLFYIYMMRVGTFFRKRFNILAIYFGEQRMEPAVSPEKIQKIFNEVMIERFESVSLSLLNFPHLPQSVEVSLKYLVRQNNISVDKLYHYNKQHFDILQREFPNKHPQLLYHQSSFFGAPSSSGTGISSKRLLTDLAYESSSGLVSLSPSLLLNLSIGSGSRGGGLRNPLKDDPILKMHIKNTSNLDYIPSSSLFWEDNANKYNLRSNTDYQLFFDWDESTMIRKSTELAYIEYFENFNDLPKPKSFLDLDVVKWSFTDDFDPSSFIPETVRHIVFKRRTVLKGDLLELKIQSILDNEQRRRQLSREAAQEAEMGERDAEEASENKDGNESISAFYDDLNETLYTL